MIFIRVFEFHCCGRRRSKDGRLCWNGSLHWYGRLYRSRRSWGVRTRALEVLYLQLFNGEMVILIRARGITTHWSKAEGRPTRLCNVWRRYIGWWDKRGLGSERDPELCLPQLIFSSLQEEERHFALPQSLVKSQNQWFCFSRLCWRDITGQLPFSLCPYPLCWLDE